jgi:hypothetical protein
MNYGKLVLERIQAEQGKLFDSKNKEKLSLLHHKENDINYQIKYKGIDNYGIVLDYISVALVNPILDVDLINQKLEEQSEKLQQTITYLLEDFKLIELDKMNKRAQLRSYPPFESENSKYYYEIVVEEGIRCHFQRYLYSKDSKRFEKITSQFTLEIFERLINDLTSVLK